MRTQKRNKIDVIQDRMLQGFIMALILGVVAAAFNVQPLSAAELNNETCVTDIECETAFGTEVTMEIQ